MKTKISKSLTLVIALALLLLPCAAIADRAPRFIDEVGLLTPEETELLTRRLDSNSEYYQFDIVVAVVQSLDHREARLFAVDFFEENGFGFGDDLDGIILLLAMDERDYGIATLGYGLYVFTDAGQEYFEELFLPRLRNNEYYDAFMDYAYAVEDFLKMANAGTPYGSGNIPLTPEERTEYYVTAAIISIVLALLIAIIVTSRWKAQLKSVRKQDLAHAYIRDDSMVLAKEKDIFLYRRVHRERRAEQQKSGSGGSFTSSSGRSSSGRSGKF